MHQTCGHGIPQILIPKLLHWRILSSRSQFLSCLSSPPAMFFCPTPDHKPLDSQSMDRCTLSSTFEVIFNCQHLRSFSSSCFPIANEVSVKHIRETDHSHCCTEWPCAVLGDITHHTNGMLSSQSRMVQLVGVNWHKMPLGTSTDDVLQILPGRHCTWDTSSIYWSMVCRIFTI